MPRKKVEPPTSLRIGLFDPGMTPLHRAGLGGLAATLQRLVEKDFPGSWVVEEDHITLEWEKDKTETFFEQLLLKGLEIQKPESVGIIDFPALRDRLGVSASYEARLVHQEALMGTLLQHGKSRSLDSAKFLVLDPDNQKQQKSYRPMLDFNHRQQASAIVKALKPSGSSTVSIVGWAYPGAVEKHPGKSWSRMETSAGEFLALCFAPVGTLSFKVRSRLSGQRHAYALVVPVVSDLKRFGRFRSQFARFDAAQFHVSSPSDAGLMIASAMHMGLAQARHRHHQFLQVMTFGTQPWASQQKTRTKVMYLTIPEERTLALYRFVVSLIEFQPQLRKGKNNSTFYSISPVREAITEALAEGKPWYAGLVDAYIAADSSLRNVFHYMNERRGLHAMINHPESLEQQERLFIEVCHNAMRQIYGSVAGRTKEANTDFGRKAEVEMTKIRSSLLRAKNEDTLRDALVEFWAKASREKVRSNSALRKKIVTTNEEGEEVERSGWEVLLPMLDNKNWRKARQLALLSLLSYSGVEQPDEDDTQDTAESDDSSD